MPGNHDEWERPASPSDSPFRGKRVLVVEDEFFLADDIASRLKRMGAEVIGPAGGIADATSLIFCSERIDFAVLDFNLQGELAFSVGALLLDRGVPFILTTGYDKSSVPDEFQRVPYWNKPYNVDEMLAFLSSLASSTPLKHHED